MFLIGACTWIANDINDAHRDQINHPDRPIPSGRISREAAATIYFISLAAALVITHAYVPPRIAVWYYLTLTLALSYGYVVDLLPSFKAPYVGAAMAIPVIIVGRYIAAGPDVRLVATATFLFASGKELCMDILDRPGDTPSMLHRIQSKTLAITAFGVQLAGLASLILQHLPPAALLYWAMMATLFAVATTLWFQFGRFRLAVALVRLQLPLGVFFLVRLSE